MSVTLRECAQEERKAVPGELEGPTWHLVEVCMDQLERDRLPLQMEIWGSSANR